MTPPSYDELIHNSLPRCSLEIIPNPIAELTNQTLDVTSDLWPCDDDVIPSLKSDYSNFLTPNISCGSVTE